MSQIQIKGFVRLLPPPEPAEPLSLYFVRPGTAAPSDPFDLFFSDADGTLCPMGNISFVEAIITPLLEGLAPLENPSFTGDEVFVEPADDAMHVHRVANIGYVQDKLASFLADTINGLIEARVSKARPIVTVNSARALLPSESGTEFRVNGAISVSLPDSDDCVVGETVFYMHQTSAAAAIEVFIPSGTDTIVFHDTYADNGLSGATTMGVKACGYAEIRLVAAGKWRACGDLQEI